MKVTFTVVSCNPNKDGGFVFKLENIEEVQAFGMTKNIKRTYYIGGMPQEVAVGTKFEEELNNFEIKERSYVIETEDDAGNAKEETIWLKWLHVKSSVDRNTKVTRA
jgi:hypothetical protein